MLTIALNFPAGRFHATPWGRHVNEGAPEWPPSPWRLLRSLLAAWKMKCAELSEDQVLPILKVLASPPAFGLPEATLGHTRHYMRWYKKGPEDQTLVFDSFVGVARESELLVCWPGAFLESDQRTLLATLLGRLGYLGRAESWCEGRLLDEGLSSDQINCSALGDREGPTPTEELVRVLCADPKTAFSDEHVRVVAKKKRPVYDPAWHLAIETGQLHAEKWSDPPGSQWVTYTRPADCFRPRPTRVRRGLKRPRMQVARYALDASVLPLVTATLPVAERARAALMARMPRNGEARRRSQVFSGKDADGSPLSGHGHAYYLPTDEDHDGRLDHLTVFALHGFGDDELRAIDRLRVMTQRGDEPEIRLLLLGVSQDQQFQVPPLGPSRDWVSATPFLVTRHPKKSGVRRDPPEILKDPQKFVETVIQEELARFVERRGGELLSVERILDDGGAFRTESKLGPPRRALEFKRFRSRKADDGGRRMSGFFRIHFREPIFGPLALGHSSHFGMGLFLAEDRS